MNTRIFRLAAISFALAACVGSLHSADGITWGTINLPPTGTGSTIVPFTAIATNTGTTTWGTTYALEMRDANGGRCDTEYLTTSIPPGGTATITFHLSVPASLGTYNYRFTALNSSGNFGTDQWRSIVVTDLLGGSAVGLSAYTFSTSQLPIISTLAPMPTPPTGQHKLRAKVLNVPGYVDGFHAATAWNNNGLPLDVAPPPATYASQLYWLKYDNSGNNLLQIGPFKDATFQISQSRVQLSSYYFNSLNRPTITTDESIPPQYKLAATVLFGANSPLLAAVSWNNQGQLLDWLPPPGTYTVQFYWQKFEITGTTVIAVSSVQTDTITVSGDSTIHLLDQIGTIVGDDAYDDDGNYVGTTYPQYATDFTIPTPGQLHYYFGTCDFTTEAELIGMSGNLDFFVSGIGRGPSLTVNALPGLARIWIDPMGAGNYEAFVDLVPSAPPCTITSGSTASATLWTPFNGYQITASPVATTFYAGGLPLGLRCDPVTGVISGTPTQAGTFTVALYAANPSGIGPTKALTLTVAKATPALTVAGQTTENQVQPLFAVTSAMLPTAAAGAAGLPAPTGTITYTAVRVDTLGATSTINLANSLPLPMTALYGELRVTASYPGDANYLPATKTATFVNRDTHKPDAPFALVQTLLGPASFAVDWAPSVELESFIKYYEVSVDNGAQALTTRGATLSGGIVTPTLTTVAVNNVSAGTAHAVKVRAVDWFNNTSDWSATLIINTPPAGTTPPVTSQWDDVNGDGLKDELIPAGTSAFSIFESETGTRTVSYSTTTWEFISVFNVAYGDGWDLYVSGAWHVVDNESTYTVATVRPGFQILAEPGYDYGVTWNVTTPNGQLVRAVLAPAAPLEPATALTSAIHEVIAFNQDPLSATAFYAYPTTLVRIGKPAGGIQLDLGVLGKLQIDTGGGLRGKLTLAGGIVINATQGGGATINIPSSIILGGVTVTSSGGNVTVSGSPGGGYGVTLGSGGNAALTIPGGGTIGIGPGGASLTTASGLGISVTGNGQISLSVPQGSGQKLDNVLDTLGKVLGIGPGGPNLQVQVVSHGGVLTTGGWAGPLNTDLGNRPPGDYDVAVKADDDNNTHPPVWIRLTVHTTTASMGVTDLAHWNIDNDDNSPESVGDTQPGADYRQTETVVGEDDLVPLTLTYQRGSTATGTVNLSLNNSSAKLWQASNKGATPFLVGPGTKTWNITDTLPSQLWVEGVSLGTTAISLTVNKPDGTPIVSSSSPVTFVAAIAGRQPIHTERVDAQSIFPNIVHCEWSITGELTAAYNCIGWSVGDTTRFLWGRVDSQYGNNNNILEDSDFDAMYAAFGYVPCSFAEAEIMLYRTGVSDNSATHEITGLPIINPTGITHAARKILNPISGAGRWVMFESKRGQNVRIEHRQDALNNTQTTSSLYGAPYRYYKKSQP